MRKLASIQIIDKIDPIEGKDLIGLAKVLGWHVIVRKSEFSVGDKCIYFEVDSLLPETPDFEFLRKRDFRIKTMRMGGVISEGLAMPINILPVGNYNVGDDVTEIIGVKKYENDSDLQGEVYKEEKEEKKSRSKIVRFLMGFSAFRRVYLYFNPGKKSYGDFPENYISKTDETRIQAIPWVFDENKGKKYVLGEKLDGCSFSTLAIYNKTPWFKKDNFDFLVCSRNRRAGKGSVYWEIANKYNLKKLLTDHIKMHRDLSDNLTSVAIQGEIVGPKIQGNKYKLSENKLFIFNVIYNGERLDYQNTVTFCEKLGLDMVPIVAITELPETLDELVSLSNGQSVIGDTLREGFVCRLLADYSKSFKVISPEFKLRYGL